MKAGAGAVLTLARPHLLVLIPVLFLVRRSAKAFAAFAAGLVILVLGSLALVGIGGWQAYARLLLPGALSGTVRFANANQGVFGVRGIVDAITSTPHVDVAVPVLLLLGIAIVLALRPSRPWLDFALVSVGSLDASLHQNLHDLTLLLAGMIPLTALLLRGELRMRRLGWAVLAAAYLGVDAALFSSLVAAVAIQLLLAYVVAERLLAREPGTESAAASGLDRRIPAYPR